MRYKLVYGQFRPASYDQTVAIGEKREKLLEVKDEAAACRAAKSFLKKGSVLCGEKIHRRVQIELHQCAPWQSAFKPKPEFIPMYESN